MHTNYIFPLPSGLSCSAFHMCRLSRDNYLRPLLPNVSRLPSIPLMSRSLNLNSAPLNLPTPGAPTTESLALSFFLPFPVSLSRIIPFSLASLLRFVSRAPAAATMPLRIFIGIFSCLWIDSFDPSACTRRSVALCRVRPAAKALGATVWPEAVMAGARRWDSERRRRSSRSWARRLGASSARVVVDAGVVVVVVEGREVGSGGREDWEFC